MKEPQTIKAKKVDKFVVLSNGEVWNMDWYGTKQTKKVKQSKNNDGYLRFNFNGKKVQTHRLIAKCFLPNLNNLPQVNHKNEVKDDNRVDNLEWCTAEYNSNYGTRNERISKPVYQYTKDGQFVAKYESLHEVQRLFGYDNSTISACCNGKRKSAYGYIWSYNPPANI